MPDPSQPRKPQRPTPYKSDWSPRPIPQAAPERRTADAPTPKLKQLAARTQRAAVADATRVAPPKPPQESPTRLANDPFAYAKHLEKLEAARQAGSVADKVGRKAERAALVARGRALGSGPSDPSGGELRPAADRLEQYTRDIELARVSNDMYNPKGHSSVLGWSRVSDSVAQLPPSLRDERLWRDEKSGFAAGLYKEAPELGGRTVLAYRGTADWPGWQTDASNAFKLSTAQYDKAQQLATAVAGAYGANSVVTTGHSLGGGESGMASAMTGMQSVVFNPAGLSPAAVERFGGSMDVAARSTTTYHTPGEALSALQSPVGRVLSFPVSTELKEGIVAYRSITEGRLPIREELTPNLIPPSIGRHVVLPDPGGPSPVPLPSSPLGMAVPLVGAVESVRGLAASGMRHTAIFAIQGMEDQKAHDRATIEHYTGGSGAR